MMMPAYAELPSRWVNETYEIFTPGSVVDLGLNLLSSRSQTPSGALVELDRVGMCVCVLGGRVFLKVALVFVISSF